MNNILKKRKFHEEPGSQQPSPPKKNRCIYSSVIPHDQGRISTLANRLNLLGNQIVTLINKNNILTSNYTVTSNVQSYSKGAYVTFSIISNQESPCSTSKTYSRAAYDSETEGKESLQNTGAGRGVYSELGNRTGSFLFNLQLLLVILGGISEFNLENFTDDPARAALGIYKLLKVDTRKTTTGHDRKEFVDKSLGASLDMSEGQMIYVLRGDSFDNWKQNMRELAQKLNGEPWNTNIINGITRFISNLEQYPIGGGKKKRRRKSIKKKRRKRRTRRKKYHNITRRNK